MSVRLHAETVRNRILNVRRRVRIWRRRITGSTQIGSQTERISGRRVIDHIDAVHIVGARRRIAVGTLVIVPRAERVANAGIVFQVFRCVGARRWCLTGLFVVDTMAERE